MRNGEEKTWKGSMKKEEVSHTPYTLLKKGRRTFQAREDQLHGFDGERDRIKEGVSGLGHH